VNFEAYLSSKKIDSAAFKKAEPVLWESWRKEFDLIHPNSFTAQKLYLINPIRRKYQLALETLPEVIKSVEKISVAETAVTQPSVEATGTPVAKPAVARPVMKPKLPTSPPSTATTSSVPPPSTTTTPETSSTEQAAPKPAKPVMVRPVMKPKPIVTAPSEEATPPTPETKPDENIGSDTIAKDIPPKPVKPVIPKPVIKPPKPKME